MVMVMTEYTVLTPVGGFKALWPEDEDAPVQYSGSAEGIAYLESHIENRMITRPGGYKLSLSSLEPSDLYDFCRSEEAGIAVIPDAVPDSVLMSENEGDTMNLLDAVSVADEFALIGEGAQILKRLSEDSDTFFEDLGRLREIVVAIGGDAEPYPAAYDYEGRKSAIVSALAAYGWSGGNYPAKGDMAIRFERKMDGDPWKGRDVTGATIQVIKGSGAIVVASVDDDVAKTPEQIASAIDSLVGGKNQGQNNTINPTSPDGYAAVKADKALQEKYQDDLDAMFQERIVAVRNALVSLGWSGSSYTIQQKKVGGSMYGVTFKTTNIGAGNNVVAVSWSSTGGGDSITDDLTKTPEELAKQIDAAVVPAAVEPAAGGISTPSGANEYLAKNIAQANALYEEAKQKGLNPITPEQFMVDVNSGNRGGFSIEKIRERLDEAKRWLAGVLNGSMTPGKVMGKGATKKQAIDWLEGSIEENTLAIESGGIAEIINVSNYSYYLRDLIKTGMDTTYTGDKARADEEAARIKREAEMVAEAEALAAKAAASRSYQVGTESGMKNPLTFVYSIATSGGDSTLAELADISTPEEKYAYLEKRVRQSAGIVKRIDKTQFNRMVDFNGARRAGIEFAFFKIEPRAGFSKVSLTIDLAGAVTGFKPESVGAQGATQAAANEAVRALSPFLSSTQRGAMKVGMLGEEGQYFRDKAVEMAGVIAAMPKTYEQDGKGDAAVAHLHYFKGGADWYITEKDMSGDGTEQAFGLADLGYGPELGYISIAEIVSAGAELDLHWTPKTIGAVKGSDDGDNAAPNPVPAQGPLPWDGAPSTEETRWFGTTVRLTAIDREDARRGLAREGEAELYNVINGGRALAVKWPGMPSSVRVSVDGQYVVEVVNLVDNKPAESASTPAPVVKQTPAANSYIPADGPQNIEEAIAAGATEVEQNKIAINPAMSKKEREALRKSMPAGFLVGPGVRFPLRYESDVTIAEMRLAEKQDEQAYKPFDESKVRQPTAKQLGINVKDNFVTLEGNDGWSNRHLLDLVGKPAVAGKVFAESFGGNVANTKNVKVDGFSRIVNPAKASATIKVEPTAMYAHSKFPSVILTNEAKGAAVAVNLYYYSYFAKNYKGAAFYASDDSNGAVVVKRGGDVIGVIMPVRNNKEKLLKFGVNPVAPTPAPATVEPAAANAERSGFVEVTDTPFSEDAMAVIQMLNGLHSIHDVQSVESAILDISGRIKPHPFYGYLSDSLVSHAKYVYIARKLNSGMKVSEAERKDYDSLINLLRELANKPWTRHEYKAASGEPAPSVVPEQTPEPVQPTEDTALAEAKQYLQSVIDGAVPFDESLSAKLEDLYAKHEADADFMALFEQAANVYSDAMIKAAQAAMA